MANVRPPQSDWITVHADSRRWNLITPRPDDIVISTPPKSGTTWTQGIVFSLMWPAGDPPVTLGEASPWLDFRLLDVADQIEAQPHRRFLKTHTPADCLAISDETKYLVVYRDGRDALVSWDNHRTAFNPDVMDILNASATEDGVEPLRRDYSDDLDYLQSEFEIEGSPVRHLASWWPLRDQSNVCFVHYADLLADLDGEMRRIADFLDIAVSDELWPQVVERCRIDEMRAAAGESGMLDIVFDGGATAFFNKGTNGRWVGVLTDEQVDRYLQLVADELPTDAAAWLEQGSLALGRRPDGAATC